MSDAGADAGYGLLADIGGTNVRFALVARGSVEPEQTIGYRSADFIGFESAARAEQLPVTLLEALAWRESQWDASAVNEQSGAIGIGQLLPETATFVATQLLNDPSLDPKNARDNIRLTARYLRALVDRFGGDTDDYLKWLIELREDRKRRPHAGDATEMRHFVRSVYQRHTMRTRRRRLALAREIAALRDGKVLEGAQRAAFEAKLLVSWIAQRDEWVTQASHDKVLSYAERIELQGEFWAALDRKLEEALRVLVLLGHPRDVGLEADRRVLVGVHVEGRVLHGLEHHRERARAALAVLAVDRARLGLELRLVVLEVLEAVGLDVDHRRQVLAREREVVRRHVVVRESVRVRAHAVDDAVDLLVDELHLRGGADKARKAIGHVRRSGLNR